MTENPNLLAAQAKADLATQANATNAAEGRTDSARDYDARPEHQRGSGQLGYVPGGADLERDDTITAPVPDWLIPEKAKAAAFKWNTLDERLDKAEDELRAARAAAASAPTEDHRARKTALAAGRRYSGTPAQDKAAERLTEATENMRILNELTREAGRALIKALRDNRSEVLRLTDARLSPAITHARQAAAQAEAAIKEAAAEVAEANSGLTLIESLDSNQPDWVGAFTIDVPTPSMSPLTRQLDLIESNLGVVETPLKPKYIRVETANGIIGDVLPESAKLIVEQFGGREIPLYEGTSGLPETVKPANGDSFGR